VKEFHIKKGEKTLSLIKQFSPTEKVIFSLLILVALISSLLLVNRVNEAFLVPVVAKGGSLNEGTIGLPRYINPVLAFTDVDRDLSALMYSGLMKYDQGKITGDLAESYSVSDDGLIYTFILRDDLYFHDGILLTTDDVEFTIQKIQDANLKSPKGTDWANITIKKIDRKEIQFILKQPYSPFLTNTTIGILPKHIWNNVDTSQFIFSQYNLEPIGSGPFKLSSISIDSGGIPKSYKLVSFDKYSIDEAHLSSLFIYFYPNEQTMIDAYITGAIESMAGISPQEVAKIASTTPSVKILSTPLPRIFGVFFNQNNATVLANKEVRQALDMAIDKDRIIDDVLYGYGVKIDSPIPVGIINSTSTDEIKGNKEAANEILKKAGWLINSDGILEKKDKKTTQVLKFSIATADTPEFKRVAEIIKQEWESMGAEITIKVFEYGDLSQNIIKTRKYDALLFGESIGKDLDLYAFWHSSQRNSPGLNVSLYVNSKVDKILENAREISDEQERIKLYDSFQTIIKDDLPAIFLYSPEYLYILPNKLQGVMFGPITNPSDRWYGSSLWYIETDNVWKVFKK
jgi:peptide/nickel transport system substrate-binding protein